MKAVVMCGGSGSRLRPLTETEPKPLVRLMNRPVLDIILEKLAECGFGNVMLSLGYKAQEIISHCEMTDCGVRTEYREETKPLGTAGGVKNCLGKTDGDVLVLSGDNIFDIDLKKAAEYHSASGADVTVVGKKAADPREYGVIVKDENGRILSFEEKPDWENVGSDIINTGIYIIKGEILGMIPENRPYDFAGDLFPELMRQNKKFMCYLTDEYWGDMGEFEAYRSITEYLFERGTDIFDFAGNLIRRDMTDENGCRFIAPCLVGRNVKTSPDCIIGAGSVLGDGTELGKGCTVEKSILGSGCRIGAGAEIRGCILSDNVTVGENSAAETDCVIGYGVTTGRFSRILSGCRIWPGAVIEAESIVSSDVYYRSETVPEFDAFGMTGKINLQISLSDAVRIGQAIASVKSVERAGVATDGSEYAGMFRDCICAGLRSCGADCYDFASVYTAQICFYSCYCELDAFIFVSGDGERVSVSFYGKHGFPFTPGEIRSITSNCRFRSFSFADTDDCGKLYDMELFTAVYRAALRKKYQTFSESIALSFECENDKLREILSDIVVRPENSRRLIRLIFGKNGRDVYFVENERIFSSAAALGLLCEMRFAAGGDAILPEDAPAFAEDLAEKFGRKVFRADRLNADGNVPEKAELLDSLWAFDAVFLAFDICSVMAQTGMSLSALLENGGDCIMQKKVYTFDMDAGELRRHIGDSLGKKPGQTSYYTFRDGRGSVRVRQLGNTNRVRVLAEAAELETARELTDDIINKIKSACIDKRK